MLLLLVIAVGIFVVVAVVAVVATLTLDPLRFMSLYLSPDPSHAACRRPLKMND